MRIAVRTSSIAAATAMARQSSPSSVGRPRNGPGSTNHAAVLVVAAAAAAAASSASAEGSRPSGGGGDNPVTKALESAKNTVMGGVDSVKASLQGGIDAAKKALGMAEEPKAAEPEARVRRTPGEEQARAARFEAKRAAEVSVRERAEKKFAAERAVQDRARAEQEATAEAKRVADKAVADRAAAFAAALSGREQARSADREALADCAATATSVLVPAEAVRDEERADRARAAIAARKEAEEAAEAARLAAEAKEAATPRGRMSGFAAEAMAEVLRSGARDAAASSRGRGGPAASAEELLSRVHRLEEELAARAREEALRLSDFAKAYDARWEELSSQAAEERVEAVRAQARAAVAESRAAAEAEVAQAVEEARAALEAEARREVERAVTSSLGRMGREREEESAARLADLASVRREAQRVKTAARSRDAYETAAGRAMRAAVAAMGLWEGLDSPARRGAGRSRDVTREIEALRVAGAGDAILAAAADAMPPHAHRRGGIPTHADLAARMTEAARAVRAAALAPRGAGIVGHVVGTAAGAVVERFGPSPFVAATEAAGKPAPGAAATPAQEQAARSSTSLKHLAAAEAALAGRRYGDAAAALRSLEGHPARVAAGICADVEARAAAEQSLRLARAQAATIVAAMY